ncbi:hypothetical protein V757_02275 [Pelistega indica]|uniref:Uncharacterized protein n=1 Tax=Pelistega indica TaxID=1414851 RepID=V8G8N4_9BURK|nr:hypothetical protein V757_02275 [Pelistega indica]
MIGLLQCICVLLIVYTLRESFLTAMRLSNKPRKLDDFETDYIFRYTVVGCLLFVLFTSSFGSWLDYILIH